MAYAKFASVILVLVCIWLYIDVTLGQFHHKDHHHRISLRKKHDKSDNNFFLEINAQKCRDRYDGCEDELCHRFPNNRAYHKRMRKICKKTCGYCRALSPPQCYSSRYGCCWNFITPAMGPGGKGCGSCGDNRRFPITCSIFHSYCRKRGPSGMWMRNNCPHICGHCELWSF